jgi:hypothetical protein
MTYVDILGQSVDIENHLRSKRGSCPAVPMGSRTVRQPASCLSLLSHTTGRTPALARLERWGLADMSMIGLSKSISCLPKIWVSTALPTASFSGTGVSKRLIRAIWILDVQPVVHSGPPSHCAPANQSAPARWPQSIRYDIIYDISHDVMISG